MGGFQNPIVGGTALRIPAIQSPDFQSGVTGWIIRIDGSAEFNDLTIRGTFNGSDFILNADGMFIYSGTPANGNLIANITANPGTDAFGNTYLAGIVSYSGPAFASLNDSNLLVGLVAEAIDAGVVGLSGSGGLFLSSPTHLADAATMAMKNGSTATTPLNAAGYPHVDIGASSAGTMGWINGAWVHSTVSAGTSTADVWQIVGGNGAAYNTNWLTSSTFNGSTGWPGLKYRIDAQDNLVIIGCYKSGGTAGGTSVVQLPLAYRPSVQWPVHVARNNAGTLTSGMAQISAAGNLNLLGSSPVPPVANAEYLINGIIPLGNIS